MQDFIDLEGASGASYRFRLWPEGAPHLPTGGNYVYARKEPRGFTVLVVGESNDLSQARSEWPEAVRRGATHAFTRLNVSRAIRTAEHQDLAARHGAQPVSERAG